MLLSEITEQGTYGCVVPTPASLALLEAWAHEHGIPMDDGLHVTILYSRKPVFTEPLVADHIATPIGFMNLGKALVLKLECPSLQARHEQLIALGGTHDFDSYKPHLTIMADPGEFKPEDMPPVNFGITLNCEVLKPNMPH